MPQFDISQTYILQGLQLLHNLFLSVLRKEFDGLVYGHLQYVVDIHVVELHFQRVCLEAFAVAGFAFQYKVCHELHLHRDGAFTLAFLATAAFAVEAEVSGTVSHLLGKRLVCP